MSNDEHQAAALRAHMTSVDQRLSMMATALEEYLNNEVLEAGTWQLNTQGLIERQYRIPYRAVAIDNQSTALVVVEAAESRGVLPTLSQVNGPGIFVVPPATSEVYNISGMALTVYGSIANDRVGIQVFTKPQNPGWR